MAKILFGRVTAYLTKPFCMAFVFLIVVFVIDQYCLGVSNYKHCMLSFFHFDLLPLQGDNSKA